MPDLVATTKLLGVRGWIPPAPPRWWHPCNITLQCFNIKKNTWVSVACTITLQLTGLICSRVWIIDVSASSWLLDISCLLENCVLSFALLIYRTCFFLQIKFSRLCKVLYKKWSFPLRIFSINVTKSAGTCGFSYIYWRKP